MCKPAEAWSFGREVLPGQGGTGQVGPGSDISCCEQPFRPNGSGFDLEWPGKNGAATDRGHCSNGHLGLRFNEDIDVSLTVQHQRTADDSRRIVYNHHIDIRYHINISTIISGPHLSLALASSVTVSIPGYTALVVLLQESLKQKSQEQQKHNQTQSELVWTPKISAPGGGRSFNWLNATFGTGSFSHAAAAT